jgi:hypothetical protein
MTSEISKILNHAADYICPSCGTFNCNDGRCERCGSLQYGSPLYRRRAHSEWLASLSREERRAYDAKCEAEADANRRDAMVRQQIAERDDKNALQLKRLLLVYGVYVLSGMAILFWFFDSNFFSITIMAVTYIAVGWRVLPQVKSAYDRGEL